MLGYISYCSMLIVLVVLKAVFKKNIKLAMRKSIQVNPIVTNGFFPSLSFGGFFFLFLWATGVIFDEIRLSNQIGRHVLRRLI